MSFKRTTSRNYDPAAMYGVEEAPIVGNIGETTGAPTHTPGQDDATILRDTSDGTVYTWNPSSGTWDALAFTGGGSGAVSSVFGRSGNVIAQLGDYNDDLINATATNNNHAGGSTVKDYLDSIDVKLGQIGYEYVHTFNNTTDWGSPSGGLYTITVPQATHGVANPTSLQVQEDTGSFYEVVTTQELKIDKATGDVVMSVPDTPDTRFAGRLIIR